MMPARAREPLLIALAAAIALAAGLAFRFHHVLTEPLWLDEAYTAFAADRSLGFLWRTVPTYETHPPFYYTLMHFWGLIAGDTLAARRLPGLLCGCVILALAGVAGAQVAPSRQSRWWTGAAALALVALSPMAIEMARQVRPYALMGAVQAGGLIALLSIGRRRRTGQRAGGGAVAAVLLCEALLAWLHNIGPLHALAMGLALLVQLRPADWRGWAAWALGQGVVLLGWLPALLILVDQAPTWIDATWLQFHWGDFTDTLGLLYATRTMLPLLVALAVFGAVLLAKADGRPGDAAALGLLALLPVALSAVLSVTVAPVFLTRTLSPVVVPAMVLAARGSLVPGRVRWLGAIALLVLLLYFVRQDIAWRSRGPMQHWHLALDWLGKRWRPGDAVWAYPNEGALPFDYAARDRRLSVRARAIPMAVPARGIGFYPTGSRGAVSLHAHEIARFATDPEARTAPTLWLLRLGPNAYDKRNAMLRALEAGGRRPVSAFSAGPITIVGLRRADLPRPDYLRGSGPSL